MPDQDHSTVEKDGYQLTFYPGFTSRCVVRDATGRETELYRQASTYHLPPGQARPRPSHRLKLQGGRHGQDVTLDISDPSHRIARIVVEFYGEGHVPGGRTSDASVETLTVENSSELCPPNCGSST